MDVEAGGPGAVGTGMRDDEAKPSPPSGLRDVAAGLLFAGFGGVALVIGRGYETGTASRMGPGYFPLLIACGLIGLGTAIAAKGALTGLRGFTVAVPRPLIAIVAAILLFGFAIDRMGLFLTCAATVILAASADRETRWARVPVIALLLAGFCSVLFGALLNLSIPVWPR